MVLVLILTITKLKLKTKNYGLKTNKGFTMIELILAMSIMAILTGSVLQISRFSDTHKNLTIAVDEVEAAIRMAQNYSLTMPVQNPGEKICGFGVFTNSRVNLIVYYNGIDRSSTDDCSGFSTYNPIRSVKVEEFSFADKGVEIEPINYNVFFQSPYGETTTNKSKITVKKTGTNNKRTINVNSFGSISITN